MAVTAYLVDEDDTEVAVAHDPVNTWYWLKERVMTELDPSKLCYLPCIDDNGDTTFNRLQMGRFLEEWAQLHEMARTSEERAFVSGVEELARRVQNGVHLYLKFLGD
jgi:hypothetical protein